MTSRCESQPFMIEIEDVFHFEDGRTVFVGNARGASPFVGPMKCELLVDERLVQTLHLEGEMLPEKRADDARRSFSTTDNVLLTPAEVATHECRLRCT